MTSNYQCIRCNYLTNKLYSMKCHLNKHKKCEVINQDSLKYSDMEIYELSIIQINKRNNIKCEFCKKTYINQNSLNIHQKNYCKKKINENTNNINIETQNNIDITNNIETQNNIININIPIPFDKEWNIEHIDNYLKTILLICDNKFTAFLKNVMKNKVNLNVICNKDIDNAHVFINNKYEIIEKNELFKKSMEKIYQQLIKIKNELNNHEEVCSKIIKSESDIINEKYNNYLENDNIKDIVHDYLHNIYDENKKEAVEIFNEFNKNSELPEGFVISNGF